MTESLQKLFVFTAKDENLRRKFDFKHPTAQTNLKQMCILAGVKLWNSQQNDLKVVQMFKKSIRRKQLDIIDCNSNWTFIFTHLLFLYVAVNKSVFDGGCK